MKKCSKCKEEKPREMFAPDNRHSTGLQSQCRECQKPGKKEYYQARKEKILIAASRYRKENKERIRAYFMAFNNSPERVAYLGAHRESNKEHYRKTHKAWRMADPARAKIRLRRREAIKRLATPTWLSKEQIKEMREMYRMASELSWLSDGGLSIDHIVPLQNKMVSGLHVPWNLRIVSRSENIKKKNRFENVHA